MNRTADIAGIRRAGGQDASRSRMLIAREQGSCAGNYAPLPVVVSSAEGAWITDADGRRYLDFMSAYSAASHGHRHPRLVAAAHAQMDRVCVTSRAYYSETLGEFATELCRIAGFDRMLPMNTGAEAVETAIKAARRWGYRARGIAGDRAVILVAEGNFHGRTSTIVGFSSEPGYRADFGPFSAGFRHFRLGDTGSLDAVHDEDVCAVLVEPIQGEAGIVVPPEGWLRELRDWCDRRRVLLIFDEVQSGLGRAGRMFAFEHEGIRPDGLILGKALGGGIMPVSAFLADDEVMGLFEPGSHGSTFGGNPLAAAIGLEALHVLQQEQLPERSAVLGRHLLGRLREIVEGRGTAGRRASPTAADRGIVVRGRGLWAGVDLRNSGIDAVQAIERLARHGVLSKETHDTVVRIAPPLTISKAELDWGLDRLEAVFDELAPRPRHASAAFGSASDVRTGSDVHASSESRVRAQSEFRAGPHAQRASPTLLLCAPDHFEVSYRINPWMKPEAWAGEADRLAASAREGWRQLRETYLRLGARIESMTPQPGLPDMVFTANSAVVLDGKAVLGRFLNPERRGEEAHGRRFFESLRDRGLLHSLHETPEDVFFEGAGDAIWDAHRQVFWLGYGQRSSLAARDTLRRVFGVDTMSLELASPHYYHLDTCLCVLSGGEILWYPPAFSPDSRELLHAIAGDALVEVAEPDARRFSVNSVSIGRELVMGHCSDELRERLQALGYRITLLPLESFWRSGGSACCLTLRLDQTSGAPVDFPA